MTWIELIHLRSIGDQNHEFINDLFNQTLKVVQKRDSQILSIYRHQHIESDLCIVLQCKSNISVKPPSDLGIHLTSSLKEFGRVDHSVWIEM